MSNFDRRPFRIFNVTEDPKNLKQQVEDLRHMLLSVIHDVAVLKEVLEQKQLLTPEVQRELRAKSMVKDNSGAGATPWRSYSYYPHTLETESYLREILGFTDDEMTKYKEEAEFLQQLS